LIREGAKLVESAADVLSEVPNFLQPQSLANPQVACATVAGAPRALDKDYEILLDALGFEPAGIDILAARTGIAVASIHSMLLSLELRGQVKPHAGGRFGRVHRASSTSASDEPDE
jgi:DNA processing protein